jgi:hypothetical protein
VIVLVQQIKYFENKINQSQNENVENIEQEQEQWAVKANKNNDIKTVDKITL